MEKTKRKQQSSLKPKRNKSSWQKLHEQWKLICATGFVSVIVTLLAIHFWIEHHYNATPEARKAVQTLRDDAVSDKLYGLVAYASNIEEGQTRVDEILDPIRATLTTLFLGDFRLWKAFDSYTDFVRHLDSKLPGASPVEVERIHEEYRRRAFELISEVDRVSAHWRNSLDSDEYGKIAKNLLAPSPVGENK